MDTQNNLPVLDAVDPEITHRLVSRREAITKGATVSGTVAMGLAMGSVPVALAALSRDAWAQGALPADIKAVLDFALALEIFENEFYKAVLGTSSSTAQNNAFAPVRANVTGAALATVQQIQKHEAAHVAFLKAQGATSTLTATDFDFTGNRGNGTPGPFAAATTDLAFLLTVAQGAEDTGVRAYKGQAGNLIGNNDATHNAVLEAALRIHSVEARHAARIRRIRRLAAGAGSTVRLSGVVRGGGAAAAGATGSPSAAVVAAFDKIYGGATPESNTTHVVFNGTAEASLNASTLSNLQDAANSVSEAFDEPLTKAEVIAIVQPFFIPTLA